MEEKNKLYVGNLDYSTTEDDLRKIFEEFGEISGLEVITEGGRSKGFAFVTFQDEASAEEAEKATNGQDMNGRPLTVNVARPRKER